MEDWSPNCGHCGKLHGPNTPICYPGKKQENEMTTHKDRPHEELPVEEIIADLCSNHILRFSQREAIRRLLSQRDELLNRLAEKEDLAKQWIEHCVRNELASPVTPAAYPFLVTVPSGDVYAPSGESWKEIAQAAQTTPFAYYWERNADGQALWLKDNREVAGYTLVKVLYDGPIQAAQTVAVPDAYQKALDAALSFIGDVAPGASWWDDVWPEHDAGLLAAQQQNDK